MTRSRNRALSQSTTLQEEEASSTDPAYHLDTYRAGVEARVEDLERRMGEIARNLEWNPIFDHANTETKSPFSSRIIRFSIPCKFK